ncbi:hypothetical protein FIA58_004520 [Flavobacterium jejuense]|uniref:Uncharacterized protein n=1 Tax=Flavobacterium jejuense TaxID=1544455 RepID=A0ABX0IMB9_9FLAO|nr:hypothetical protein [Flavobacterium jejuense]NHN24935.1 hypothetical protein [Flavobacterium jejuense]
MNNQYHLLFSLHVFHDYFKEGICSSFIFQPNSATMNLIKRYGFKRNIVTNGFDFYTNTNGSSIEYLNYIATNSQQAYFEFDLILTDPNFMDYTAIPIDWIGQLSFSSSKMKVKNEKRVLTTTYSSGSSVAQIGSLKVYFKDLIVLLKSNIPCQYLITFESRATQWRYYIINSSKIKLNNPSLNSKNPITFEEPTTVTIPNGKEALLFSSGKNFLKISEVSTYKFDLVDQLNTTNLTKKIIFKGLPNPSPKNIGLEIEDGKKFITSPIYVYI